MVFFFGPNRFRPAPGYSDATRPGGGPTLDYQHLARLVDYLAFGLPVVLGLSALVLGTRDSLSHYYYAPLVGDIFVVALGLIGTFLIAYRGESPTESRLALLD